jgi:hypothetical protein|tara:strand:- start:17978 stop:18883 length:906 start_codon:yes stop_codon:yes gene_type:complete
MANIKKIRMLKKFINFFFNNKPLKNKFEKDIENLKNLIGAIKADQNRLKKVNDLNQFEFKVYSQFGEDGIIQFIIDNIKIKNKIFVEFGVENYEEANTRFLLENDRWEGLIIDSSIENIEHIKNQDYYWKNKIVAECDFIKAENINKIIKKNNIQGQIGLLSIDIDGNDYWIWECINVVYPDIVIIEYNARLGFDRSITIPYEENFQRGINQNKIIYGASLKALYNLGIRKGYSLVGTNMNGNNAFFVKNELLIGSGLVSKTPSECFNLNSFSETFDQSNNIIKNNVFEKNIIEKYPFIKV